MQAQSLMSLNTAQILSLVKKFVPESLNPSIRHFNVRGAAPTVILSAGGRTVGAEFRETGLRDAEDSASFFCKKLMEELIRPSNPEIELNAIYEHFSNGTLFYTLRTVTDGNTGKPIVEYAKVGEIGKVYALHFPIFVELMGDPTKKGAILKPRFKLLHSGETARKTYKAKNKNIVFYMMQ